MAEQKKRQPYHVAPGDRKQPMEGRCNAHRQDDTYCRAYPMPNGKCHRHGGKAATGLTAPLYGKAAGLTKSNYLPPRLQKRYKEMLKDKELLTLKGEIGVIDTRLSELYDELGGQSGAKMWRRLKIKANAYHRAVKTRHKTEKEKHLADMLELIAEGDNQFQKWSSILDLIDTRRRTVESERRRQVEMQQMMSTQQAMVFMDQIVKIVTENVKDPVALKKIASGFNSLVNTPERGQA